MSSNNRYVLTPEQEALREHRQQLKRQRVAAAEQEPIAHEANSGVLKREWVTVSSPYLDMSCKVMTWNILAQTLVRRDLFPKSDCLKTGQRQPLIAQELSKYGSDIICLQEVDTLEKLRPILDKNGYEYVFATGPRKKHGCLIAFLSNRFQKVAEKTIFYDDEEVAPNRSAKTFRTKNIGLLAALKDRLKTSEGVIVATTHLFWHPKYTYERTRQAGLLLQHTAGFQAEVSKGGWPCILAGDFNFTPSDPAYSLMVGRPLTAEQIGFIDESRVIHQSVDERSSTITAREVSQDTPAEDQSLADKGNEEDGEQDPDRVVTNARNALEEDGLMRNDEWGMLYGVTQYPWSAYDVKRPIGSGSFGDRFGYDIARKGYFEPQYTSYTEYWKTTLDYIFVLNPTGRQGAVGALLDTVPEADLKPGLPLKKVSPSDHVSLVAELFW